MEISDEANEFVEKFKLENNYRYKQESIESIILKLKQYTQDEKKQK